MKSLVNFINEARVVKKTMKLQELIKWYFGTDDLKEIDGDIVNFYCDELDEIDEMKVIKDNMKENVTVEFSVPDSAHKGAFNFIAHFDLDRYHFEVETQSIYPD